MTNETMAPAFTIQFWRGGEVCLSCYICRCENRAEAHARLLSNGEDLGVVCSDCLALAPIEFAARCMRVVAALRARANTLKDLAGNKPELPRAHDWLTEEHADKPLTLAGGHRLF